MRSWCGARDEVAGAATREERAPLVEELSRHVLEQAYFIPLEQNVRPHLRPVAGADRHLLQRRRDPLLSRRPQGATMSALTPSATTTAPGGPTSGLAPAAPSAAARTARRYASFAARRTGQALIVVVLSYVLVFAVLAAIPGDPISARLEDPQAGYSEAEKAQIRAFHGLDRPVPVQLVVSLGHALTGDLGTSLSTSQPVTAMLAAAIPSTLALAATALVLAVLIAAVLALASRSLPEGSANTLVRALPAVFLSTPNFLIGLVLIQVLAVTLGLFSLVEPHSPGSTLAAALTLAIPVSAQIAQVFITALDEAAGQDYAEVALARGMRPGQVVVRHLPRPPCRRR
ncbi:ABC transporter permease subunit [Brachybacterium sp. GPGPB12]|uniref:ABC transporter permease n=1 Tax=Brachybacterium sp. GPGPB12 TaxID=3023517 RepID=UPI0031344747